MDEYIIEHLRPYQLACIYKLQYDIAHGKRRLFVDMPLGSGKFTTIQAFFYKTVDKDDNILFLHSRRDVVDQMDHRIREMYPNSKSRACTFTDLLNNSERQSIEDYHYIVVDFDRLYSKNWDFVDGILENFRGIIIGTFYTKSDYVSRITSKYGGVSYSLTLANAIASNSHKYLSMDLINKEEQTYADKEKVEIFEEDIINVVSKIENSPLKSLICLSICENKDKEKNIFDSEDMVIDLIALLAGFLTIGPMYSIILKYIYVAITKLTTNRLRSTMRCSECKPK